MYSQAHCLTILRLAAYVFSGSLSIYSLACCLSSTLRLTAYVFSGSLPIYSQTHCLCNLRLTAYVLSGSLLSILRLTTYVFSGLLPMYSQAHCLSAQAHICICMALTQLPHHAIRTCSFSLVSVATSTRHTDYYYKDTVTRLNS